MFWQPAGRLIMTENGMVERWACGDSDAYYAKNYPTHPSRFGGIENFENRLVNRQKEVRQRLNN